MKNFQKFMHEMAVAASPIAAGKNIGEDYGTLRKHIAGTIKNLEELMNKYEERVNELHTLLGQKGVAFKGQMAGKDAEIASLKTSIDTMTKDAAKLRSEHEEAVRTSKQQIEELTKRVGDLGVDKGHFERLANGAREDVERSSIKVQELTEKYDELKRRYDQEAQQHSDTWKDRTRIQGELDAEKAAHAVTRGQLAGKTGESDAAVQAAEELAKFLEELNTQLQQENESLKQNISSLEAQVDSMAGADSFSASGKKKRELDLKHHDKAGLTGLNPDLAHAQNKGFNLKEHLERAAKSQGVKRSWF